MPPVAEGVEHGWEKTADLRIISLSGKRARELTEKREH
jgi:hypothetical protein